METSIVEIFIDNKPYKSPALTTGHALYILGNVNSQEYDLYIETPNIDDELIKDDDAKITVTEKEQFFTSPKKINPGA